MRPLLILLFAATFAAHAQQVGQNASPSAVPTISVSSQLVIETVSVKDRNGQPISGLTAKDFALTENGVPQTIHFCEHQDLPAETPVSPAAQPAAGISRFTTIFLPRRLRLSLPAAHSTKIAACSPSTST
jgi:hypothetical protein